jgi:hypothetical protein
VHEVRGLTGPFHELTVGGLDCGMLQSIPAVILFLEWRKSILMKQLRLSGQPEARVIDCWMLQEYELRLVSLFNSLRRRAGARFAIAAHPFPWVTRTSR